MLLHFCLQWSSAKPLFNNLTPAKTWAAEFSTGRVLVGAELSSIIIKNNLLFTSFFHTIEKEAQIILMKEAFRFGLYCLEQYVHSSITCHFDSFWFHREA